MAVDRVFAKATTWQRAKPLFLKVGGSWQRVKTVWVKVSGTWQQVFGEAVSLTATGAVIGPSSWTFTFGIFADAGDTIPGGGIGCVVRLETTIGGTLVAEYADYEGAGNSAPVDVDETASYTAKLYDKAGTYVDTITFTPA